MVYVLLGTGFEEIEAVTPIDLLRRAGVAVTTVGLNGKIIKGSHKVGFESDVEISDLDVSDADMIVLPGGLGGVASISACPAALHAVEQVWKQGGFVAAICAAPTVLAALHITDGHPTTCYPGCEEKMGAALPQSGKAVVRDGKLITGTSAGCAVPFALALVAALKGEEKAREIAEQIVIR